MSLNVKTFASAKLKALDDQGAGSAVIATLNVIDKDGDVTLPGAFGTQPAKMVPAHDWMHVPIGKATIREEGNDVVADFQLNLDVAAAREWHEALKFDMAKGPPLQEWSYGFAIEESSDETRDGERVRVLKKLKVHEISPVMVGAGVNTRTLAIKGQGQRLTDQIADALNSVKAAVERVQEVKRLRAQDGRDLQPERLEEMKALKSAIGKLSSVEKAIDDLLGKEPTEAAGEDDELSDAEIEQLFGDSIAAESRYGRLSS